MFSSFAFAGVTANSIQNFGMTWNPATNQLNISAQCKSQGIGEIVLSTGQVKTVICPTIDFGQTWLIGEQPEGETITGTLTIQDPCDTCSVSSLLNLSDTTKQSDNFFNLITFGVLFLAVILIIGYFVAKLQR